MVDTSARTDRSETELVEIVGKLSEIIRRSGLERTLMIGRLILDRFFGGQEDVWRRKHRKSSSLRRLAARPDCPLGKSALNQAVRVSIAVRELSFVHQSSHLGASHVAAVLILQQPQREQYLRMAEAQHWSVRRLAEEVTQMRRLAGEKRGRPVLESTTKAIRRLQSAVARLRRAQAGLSDVAAVAGADLSELEGCAIELRDLASMIEKLSRVDGLVRPARFSKLGGAEDNRLSPTG